MTATCMQPAGVAAQAAHAASDAHDTGGMAGMSGMPATRESRDAHDGHDSHDGHDMFVAQGDGPQFSLHGFSDITLHIERGRPSTGGDSTATGFALGQFDLYMVSRLGPNLSFLGETVFEGGPDGETAADVERIYLRYAWSDFLHVSAGRTHTALGYWNEVFHHGALLQPTAERPEALRFEDAGGLLPVHAVGLEAGGRVTAGEWDIDYVGNVGNGRGANSDMVQTSSDLNRDKATGVKLSFLRSGPVHVAFGPSFYRDLIPPDPAIVGREGSIRERILGLHAHVVKRPVEFLAEWYRVRHEDVTTAAVHQHDAGYALVVFQQRRCKPYAGFDRVVFSNGDLFYVANQRDLSRITAGVRFEPYPNNALKLEYRHDRRPGEVTDALFFQTAFSF